MEMNVKNKLLEFFKTIDNELMGLNFATVEDEQFLFMRNISEYQKGMFLDLENIDQSLSYLDEKELICFKLICPKATWIKILDFIAKNNLKVETVTNNLSNFYVCEIHGENVTKASGIKYLQEKLNLVDDQILIAGDDDNDISMLKAYKNSFIMQQEYNNGIRQHATYELKSLFEIENYID